MRELDEDNNILGPIWFSLPLGEPTGDLDREGLPSEEASSAEAQLDSEIEAGIEERIDGPDAGARRADEPTPSPEPDQVYMISGQALVILDGTPTAMAGVEVRAVRLSDGSAVREKQEQHLAWSAGDATYRFYNLSPGRYRVYAEMWVSRRLYSASRTIDVKPGEVRTDVDLSLL